MTMWRVMLNARLWNQKKYEEDWQSHPEVRRLAQSKGRCRMVSCPKKGDLVSFVCKGKIVMKGVVYSDGFEDGTDHQLHSCNVGDSRPHATPAQFAWIITTLIPEPEDIRPTGQRTWAKIPC